MLGAVGNACHSDRLSIIRAVAITFVVTRVAFLVRLSASSRALPRVRLRFDFLSEPRNAARYALAVAALGVSRHQLPDRSLPDRR